MSFNEEKLWQKFLKHFKVIGKDLTYKALLLFYVLQRKDVPLWVKSAVTLALVYFISPLDAIVDLTPLIGYSDDLAVIVAALSIVSFYVNDDVKNKAKAKYRQLFKEELDEQL